MSRLAASGLLAVLLCPAAWAGSDDCNSKRVDPFLPGRYNSGQYCGGSSDPRCSDRLRIYADIAQKYAEKINTACTGISSALNAQQSNDGQQFKSFENVKSSAIQQTQALSSMANEKAREAGRKMEANLSDVSGAPAAAGAAAGTDPEVQAIDRKVKSPGEVIQSAEGRGRLQGKTGALAFGSQLRKALLDAKNDFENVELKLQGLQDPNNPRGNGGGDTSGNGKKSGGLMDSLNPSTLMGLATAGMGLASALKQNQANSSVSSAPDTTPPTATAVGTTGLGGDGKAASQSPNMSTAATKTETPNSGSGGSPAFSASPFTPDSEVTNKGSRLASTGNATPSSSSGAAGLEGFGGGSASSRNPDSAAKDPTGAALLAKSPEDPMAGGFGGGGGGGGGGLNFGPGSSSSSDSGHTEDPLKETLQDMAAAVDSGNDGAGTATDELQADAGGVDYSASNEFLFNRVRSAIQRSLKRGGVVSGLSAKIR